MHVGIEALAVIQHHGGAREQRRVEQPPRRLGPAGIGQGPVHVVFAQVHPVIAGDRMGERIGVIALDHLRHRRRARREIDQHRLVRRCRRQSRPVHRIRHAGTHVFQARPAVPGIPGIPDQDQVLQRRAVRADLLDLVGMFGGDDGNARVGPVDAVFDIPGGQQVGARHGDHAGLRAPQQDLIPFDNARDHHEGEIALFGAQRHQRIGKAVRQPVEIAVAVTHDVFAVAVDGDQRGPVVFPRASGNDVEREIEVRRYVQRETGARGRIVEWRKCFAHRLVLPFALFM